jgi:hypothetical protein
MYITALPNLTLLDSENVHIPLYFYCRFSFISSQNAPFVTSAGLLGIFLSFESLTSYNPHVLLLLVPANSH